MSGINLKEMEASDMLDVLHFLLEEDLVPASPEMIEPRSDVRVAIYRDLYGRDYVYKVAKKSGKVNSRPQGGGPAMDNTYTNMDFDDLSQEQPFSPRTAPPIPYTPVSTFNPDAPMPFEGLDAPLG